MNSNIQKNKDKIEIWIQEEKTIDWITKQIPCARDTFRKYYPMYKGKQGFNKDFNYKVVSFTRNCKNCGKQFSLTGKEWIIKNKFWCSVSCAHSRKDYWEQNITHYKTIAEKYHQLKCVVCGFADAIAIHHYNKKHDDNTPENLVPLCMNHHTMIHTNTHCEQIQVIVDKYVNDFIKGRSSSQG